jgi:hypothetical protein
MCSSWATNISYRATFFLQAGVCSAFYYLLTVQPREQALVQAKLAQAASAEAARDIGVVPPQDIPELEGVNLADSDEVAPVEAAEVEPTNKLEIAKRLVWDAIAIYVIYSVVLRGWSYIINDM